MTGRMTSYSKYRQHMEKLSYMKKLLNKVIDKKIKTHKEYRKAYEKHCAKLHKEYRKLADKENKKRDELMEMIPDDKW